MKFLITVISSIGVSVLATATLNAAPVAATHPTALQTLQQVENGGVNATRYASYGLPASSARKVGANATSANHLATNVPGYVLESLSKQNQLTTKQSQLKSDGIYYDWGQGQDGWGYCYEWASGGQVLNAGQPVANYLCEQVRASFYNWGQGQDGWGYCYQWTPYGVAMNQGQPVVNYLCEESEPSHYAWGRGQNGYVYCYQFTPQGYAMNLGQPVANYLCGG